MGDMGDLFNDYKEQRQQKRKNNRNNSTRILTRSCIEFTSHNGGAHLIVETIKGKIDFWPGTGNWKVRKGNLTGKRGISNLIKYIGNLNDKL